MEQEHMSAYMRFAVDINGLHLQPGGLDGAKSTGQISCHCVMGVDASADNEVRIRRHAVIVVDSLLISRPQQHW